MGITAISRAPQPHAEDESNFNSKAGYKTHGGEISARWNKTGKENVFIFNSKVLDNENRGFRGFLFQQAGKLLKEEGDQRQNITYFLLPVILRQLLNIFMGKHLSLEIKPQNLHLLCLKI